MAKGEIAALKEALCNQYLVMKKLYVELEEEREASATAAAEALSMIRRLQREKAAEKMEACQYKRMAEERINHAEECLEVLEEVIQEKDLEIESLRSQLEANKRRKTNLGVRIPDFGEKMVLCENKSCCNDGCFRRNASLPSLRSSEYWSDKGFLDDESPIWRIGGFENEVDDLFEELVAAKGKPGWKHEAEEVSKRVKELTQDENSTVGSPSSVANNEIRSSSSPIGSMASWFSSSTTDASTDSTKRGKVVKSDNEATSISPARYEVDENDSSLERNFSGKVKYAALFHDIFEVPEKHKGCNFGETCKKLLLDTISETNSTIEMPNKVPKEASDYPFRDDEGLDKAFLGNRHESKFSAPKMGGFVNHEGALMDPRNGSSTSYSDIEQLRRRLQRLEDERVILQEDSERGKKQMREMLKQLNTIETHIKSSTSRKSSPTDESALVSIMEVCVFQF